MNNKTILIGLGVLVAVGVAGFFLIYGKGGGSNLYNNSNVVNPTTVPTSAAVQPSESGEVAKEMTIEGSEFKFSQSTINLKMGEKVSLTFKNTGAASHNLSIPDLQVATRTIGFGESDTVVFTPNKTGAFDFMCTIVGHKDLGMKGQVVVK